MAAIARIVALGASNLTRAFATLVSTARSGWGPEVQMLVASGHGRSYGVASRVICRTLPGILQSGLWHTLASLPQVATRALVTDVGNDILYGYSPQQVLAWVDAAIERPQRVTQDIVLTDLPLASIRRLSRTQFLVFRSILFPSSRLSLEEVLEKAEYLNAGLREIADTRNLKLFRLDPAWYGLDPIHIRPSVWQSAWREILGVASGPSAEDSTLLENITLHLLAPERRRLFGIEQFTPQQGVRLQKGGRIWLY